MLTREEKRRAFLIVMNGFMERYADEIEGPGMSDARLAACIAGMMRFRLVWGGPGRKATEPPVILRSLYWSQ